MDPVMQTKICLLYVCQNCCARTLTFMIRTSMNDLLWLLSHCTYWIYESTWIHWIKKWPPMDFLTNNILHIFQKYLNQDQSSLQETRKPNVWKSIPLQIKWHIHTNSSNSTGIIFRCHFLRLNSHSFFISKLLHMARSFHIKPDS